MHRREFTKIMGAVAAGVAAGSQVLAQAKKDAKFPETKDGKHVCKGMNNCTGKGADTKNSCAGKGSCATVEKHTCKGTNGCAGQGGCKASDKGCAGKNSCKGKGGCSVPVNAAHMDKKAKSSCSGKSGCKSL
jgi:hypothetical protein